MKQDIKFHLKMMGVIFVLVTIMAFFSENAFATLLIGAGDATYLANTGIKGNELLAQSVNFTQGVNFQNVSVSVRMLRDITPAANTVWVEIWSRNQTSGKPYVYITRSNQTVSTASLEEYVGGTEGGTNITFNFSNNVTPIFNSTGFYSIIFRSSGSGTGDAYLKRKAVSTVNMSSWYAGTAWNNAGLETNTYYMYLYATEITGGGETFTATFVNPTPADGVRNNTNAVFNITSTNNRTTLWFGNTSNLTNAHRVLNNVSMVDGYQLFYANFTTDGTYYYKAAADSTANTTQRSFVYDTTEPTIIINTYNLFNSSNSTLNIYNTSPTIDISLQDDSLLYGFNISFQYSDSTIYYSYQNLTLTGTNYNFNRTINVSTWPDGTYTVIVEASDAHTTNKIEDYSVQKGNGKIRFLTAEGNDITIDSGEIAFTDSVKTKDRYNFEFDFTDKTKVKRTFDLTSDKKITYIEKSSYAGHFVVWNSKTNQGNWIDFEGAGTSPTIIKVSDYHYKVIFNKNIGKVTFNSIGGLNVNIKNYLYQKSSIQVSNPRITPVTPVNEEDLFGYCTVTEGLGFDTDLNWTFYQNEVVYSSGMISSVSSGVEYNVANISNTVTSVGDTYILSCSATRLLGDSGWVNSTTRNIYSVSVDNCQNNNQTSMSFIFLDFNNTAQSLNVSATIDYKITSVPSATFQNYTFTNISINNFKYCINPVNASLFGNILLQYENSGAVYVYSTNGTILNSSLKNISLYVDGPTAVTATVYDEVSNTVEGAYIYVQRYDYVTGNYLTTGVYPTNFEGKATLYLTQNNVYYRFLIYYPYNDFQVQTTPTYITDTSISFTINLGGTIGESYFVTLGVDGALTFNNETNNFRFTFADPTASITGAYVNVYTVSAQHTTLFNSSTATGTTGTILVGVAPTNGTTYLAKAFIQYDSGQYLFDSLEKTFYGTNPIGRYGLFLLAVMTIVFAFLFTFSIPIGVIALPIPTVLFAATKIVNIDMGVAIGIEIVAIVIAVFINERG